MQLAYQSIERNRAVLEASRLIEPGLDLADNEIVDRFLVLETRIVDLDTDAFSDAVSPITYDVRAAMNDPDRTEPIPSELDTASLGRRPVYLPVYLLLDDQRVERIVLPVYGPGMWSTIHGFISLQADFATIEGVAFYEHGETPGIGDRILDPAWLAQWRGQPAYDDSGQLVLRIGANSTSSTSNSGIDAISGATVTVSAVEDLVRYWLGDDGFGPILADLRRGAQQ